MRTLTFHGPTDPPYVCRVEVGDDEPFHWEAAPQGASLEERRALLAKLHGERTACVIVVPFGWTLASEVRS